MSRILFPDWGGDKLDSHRAFTVVYEPNGDESLSLHFDNAEVTLNVCLGVDFTESSLYFSNMRTEKTIMESSSMNMVPNYYEYGHQPYVGVMHRGQQLHGALPGDGGRRINLVMWLRSSMVRNKLCPMCNNEPKLVPSVGFGDGFKQSVVNVCSMI